MSQEAELSKRILITGGAGFIGSHLARHFLEEGSTVIIYDNLSRVGTDHNLKWLRGLDEDGNLKVVINDVREYSALKTAVREADLIFHLAAQVAVTNSVTDPREDFEVNALGTFNLLEAIGEAETDPVLVYASTNKVYGGMEGVSVVEEEKRYRYRDHPQGRVVQF